MSDEKKPARRILKDLPDGRKLFIDKGRRGAGLTIGIGAESPELDEMENMPDVEDGKEN